MPPVFIFVLFIDSQLVVTVLSHHCNSLTDSGEAKVENHVSSETRPRQAALLLETLPYSWRPKSAVHVPGCDKESLEHDATRTSKPIKPSPNPDDTGPIVHCLMASSNTAWDRTRICSDASGTVMQCLRPLCHLGGRFNFFRKTTCFVGNKHHCI